VTFFNVPSAEHFCPRCGATKPRQLHVPGLLATIPCRECALAFDHELPMLPMSDEEVTYGLDEWPTADRALVTGALSGRDIRYRWEAGYVLCVPESAEHAVDEILDDVERGEPVAAEPATVAGVESSDGYEAVLDGGPEAQRAMADLFVLADRLTHAPYSVTAAHELRRLATVVRASAPPFGIDVATWRTAQDLTAAALAAVDGKQDGEVIATHARDLRTLLRAYV